jgi:hypothetical protein
MERRDPTNKLSIIHVLEKVIPSIIQIKLNRSDNVPEGLTNNGFPILL